MEEPLKDAECGQEEFIAVAGLVGDMCEHVEGQGGGFSYPAAEESGD
ncbi:MAG: hypothetical protein WCC63_02100 [Candidatus Bathyarchaeia archaeon]